MIVVSLCGFDVEQHGAVTVLTLLESDRVSLSMKLSPLRDESFAVHSPRPIECQNAQWISMKLGFEFETLGLRCGLPPLTGSSRYLLDSPDDIVARFFWYPF